MKEAIFNIETYTVANHTGEIPTHYAQFFVTSGASKGCSVVTGVRGGS